MDFLLSKPGCIFYRLLDILPFKIGISLKNLFKCGTVCDLAHNNGYGDPHATDASPTTHDLGIKRNSVKHIHHLLIHLGTANSIASNNRFSSDPLGYNADRALANRRIRAAVLLSLE
jgi:hypothetical protein